jgi:GAF domain-containing protein
LTYQRIEANDRVGKVLRFYNRVAAELVHAERSSIFITNPETGRVWLKAGTGLSDHEIEVPMEGSIVGQVITSGAVLKLNHLEQQAGTHKQTDEQTGFVTRNTLCAPIENPELGETVGAIQVLNKQDNEEFSDKDVEWLQELAEHLQSRVSQIYLEQEIFGLSESILKSSTWLFKAFLMTATILLFVVIALMALWLVVPAIN